jgi:deoxycytidine triphosphate deaminase
MISARHQVHAFALNLTARQIYALDPSGQVDFGGTEYAPSARTAVASLRKQREDKYEWWDLARGCYVLEFNEGLKLADNEIAILEPDDRLQRCGATHSTTFLRGQGERLETLLFVGTMSVQIKQNARVSRVRIFRFGAPLAAAVAKSKSKANKKARR